MGERIPAGYRQLSFPDCSAVVSSVISDDLTALLAAGTAYDYARGRDDAHGYRGRATAFAFRAPVSGLRLLVRRSRHGGVLARFTGELFLSSGRAPRELRTSLTLSQSGVRSPTVLGYVVYPAFPAFSRIDVLLSFIPDSRDLATLLLQESDPATRQHAISAARILLGSLARAGALHPDLNLRNILIGRDAGQHVAWVLDVDRITFDTAGENEIMSMNLRRLLRSIRKLQRTEGLSITDRELASLTGAAEST